MTTSSQPPAAGAEQGVQLDRWHMLLAYFCGSFGFGFPSMISFLLPLRARELGAPLEVIGLIVGSGALVPALLSVTSGALADRIGARRAFALGAAMSGVSALCFALMTNYWAMLAAQVMQGYFRTMGWVASQTYITGVGTPAERAAITGRFSFAVNVGPLIYPLLIGAVADVVGFRTSFLVAAAIGALYVAVGLALPELRVQTAGPPVPTGRQPARSLAGYSSAFSMLRLPGVQVALLLTFVRIWNSVGWQSFFPVFLQEHGFRPVLIGTVVSCNGVVSSLTTLTAGRVVRLASKEVVSGVTLGISALGIALSPHLLTIPVVYLPSLLMGIGYGISLPLLMAIMSENAPPGQRGVAMGLRTQANQIAGTLTPIAFGTIFPAVGITLGFTLAALVAWGFLSTALWIHFGSAGSTKRPVPAEARIEQDQA